MKRYLFLFSLLVLTTLYSCQKDKKCRELSPILLEQEMKDWIYFQPGSYWIYEDSVTNTVDSVYVTEAKIERKEHILSNEKCPYRIEDRVYITTGSTLGKKIQIDGAYSLGTGVINDTTNTRGTATIRNQNHLGGDGGFSMYMFFPVVQGTIGRWTGFGLIKHDTIFPTYEVKGKVFENVLRVHDNANGAYGAETKFYHAKHIGVIRKEIYEMDRDNPNPKLLQVWELIDYKVIQ
jgi:hypothetical protein